MHENSKSVDTTYEPPQIEERTSLEGQLVIIINSSTPV